MDKAYLANGEEVKVLAQYQNGSETEYVVRVVIGENIYEGESSLIYEDRIVSNVYEDYKDIPMFLRKTELEGRVEELNKDIKELTEQKTRLTRELKSVYAPDYPVGTKVYYTSYGGEVEELKIIEIVFTEQEDRSFYTYSCNREYRSFEKIGDCFFLTKEEAEEELSQYRTQNEQNKLVKIKENYEKAKKEYENQLNPPKNK